MPRSVLWMVHGYPSGSTPYSGSFHKVAVEALSRLGEEITVVAPVAWVPPPMSRLRRTRSSYAGPALQTHERTSIYRPRYLAVPGYAERFRSNLIARAVRSLAGRLEVPDIVHAQGAMPIGGAGRRVSREMGRPYVVGLRGSDVNQWPGTHRSSVTELRAVLREAAAVVAVSNDLAHKAMAWTDRDIFVIPSGVDVQAYRVGGVSREEARDALRIPELAFVILYVGNLVASKGVRDLVAALQKLPQEYMCLLVGGGPLYGYGHSSRPSIRYEGPVAPNSIPTYLRAADVLVLPSHHEGLPNVLLEAGAAGLPVIGTDVGGIPELLDGGRGIIVPHGRPDALREAILLTAADRGGAFARAALLGEHVASSYDSGGCARRLVAVYDMISR